MRIATRQIVELSTSVMAPHDRTAAVHGTGDGTRLTTPSHRYIEAPDVALTPLTLLADLPGLVVQAIGRRVIEVADLDGLDVAGRAVLLHTGGAGRGHLSAAAAGWLAARRAALVGTDGDSVDGAGDRVRPAQARLLLAGVPIVTGLRDLRRLPAGGFRMHAAPPAFTGTGDVPVRAYAVLEAA